MLCFYRGDPKQGPAEQRRSLIHTIRREHVAFSRLPRNSHSHFVCTRSISSMFLILIRSTKIFGYRVNSSMRILHQLAEQPAKEPLQEDLYPRFHSNPFII